MPEALSTPLQCRRHSTLNHDLEFLLPVAMGTDRGTALSEMRARAIVSPAITTVEELC